MNREILFKGKRKDNNEWVYGSLVYVQCEESYYIIPYTTNIYNGHESNITRDFDTYEIIPETLSQYTGSKDKNGVKIFEGDICQVDVSENFGVFTQGIVKFYEAGFVLRHDERMYTDLRYSNCERDYKIIGNVFDKVVK